LAAADVICGTRVTQGTTSEIVERAEERHYDTFAEHIARRDVIASSRIARRDIVLRAVRPVLQARGGSLGCVVDVGCGIGASAVNLNGHFDRYVGIDFSQREIEIGRTFTAGVPNVELIHANIKDASLPRQIADVIYMDGALHHMSSVAEVMQGLRRLAKPGAWFIAREPQRGNPFIQALRKLRMWLDASYSSQQRFFTKREIVGLIEAGGLESVEARYQGFLTPPLAQIVLYPQAIFVPLAHLIVLLEGVAERVMIGPLAPLSWNITVYGRFPK
jgi:SAM-dependent methyltransferase